MPEAFGKRLARLRKRHQLTQAQLAQSVGLSCQMVSSLEQGTRQGKKLAGETLDLLALRFEVSIDYLLHGRERTHGPPELAGAPAGE